MYLLDTNVIVDAIRGKFPSIRNHFIKIRSTEICIPSIVLAELEYGARHSMNYQTNRTQFMNFILPYLIIPFTNKEAVYYGEIRQQLTSIGLVIGRNDMLIAATALANNATLVTNNTDEFARVKGLALENWQI